MSYGTNVSFWDANSLSKLKEISMPTLISSASLHPDKHIFVAGGEDFKMYKYDYLTGNEIGKLFSFLLYHPLIKNFHLQNPSRDTLARSTLLDFPQTASYMPVAVKMAHCDFGKQPLAKTTDCGNALSQLIA